MEAEAEARFRDELANLEKNKAEVEQKISEMQTQKKDKSQRFILSPEQQAELTKFQKEVAETDRKLKQVRKDLRREVDRLEARVKWWNIFAMPLAVTTCGILLAVYKRKLTGAK